MQEWAPWVKLKDETQIQEGKENLEHLLWEIKQLTLISAPFLINSFKTVQTILGNEQLMKLDPSKNLSDPTAFFELYNADTLTVALQPDVVYKKKDH